MRDDSSVSRLPSVEVEVRRERADGPVGQALLEGFDALMRARYGEFDKTITPSATPEDLAPPQGAFLVLYAGGEPVACGGVKRLAADIGEIKRMFVAADARGRGYGRVLLGALEDAARQLGYPRMRLDTGAHQPEGLALYRSAGYSEIPRYNDNAYAGYWFEKDLNAPVASRGGQAPVVPRWGQA
jgi:GNAT superfamily N-acetyltransferase